jgi:hypothetical protein
MAAVWRVGLGWRDRLVALSTLDQDALLYVLAAAFALGTLFLAESRDYRQWSAMALGPYLLAAAICAAVARRRARIAGANATGAIGTGANDTGANDTGARDASRRGRDRLRQGVVLGLLLTVVLVPLTVEVILRAEAKVGAQNEVTTIEACGDRVAHHKNCYPSDPKNAGGALQNQGANSFFPYLPGMIPFGLVNATSGPPELKDARIALSGFTLIVLAGGLLVADTSTRRKWRIFQVVVVLPSGALPMVTGGDDLPVLALMFLALAFASRRRPVWSGLAMGLAGTLKFTAWPLLILLALGEWDRLGRRAILRYSLAVLAVVVPVLGIGIGQNPRAFVLNAIRFPLGLTKVKSPAASPLIGQELVKLFPAAKTELIGVLGLIGVIAVLYGLWRWRPSTPQSAAGFSGYAMLLATLLAPATRFGYLIYPLNLLTWSVLLSPRASAVPAPGQSSQEPSSGSWKRRIVRPMVGEVWPSPANAGEIEGLTGVTTTPTSHS